ncbi:MAG: GNAT family N-acetyltransferase [Candidatus Nanopelagicales bacterium]|jgi:RimJ/RimL family protein N-acetyltransferase/AcrR family transcriptional regulator|nr:GNAT family N-acetyltransferase [Candidatus Nanopelagicales bacterium]
MPDDAVVHEQAVAAAAEVMRREGIGATTLARAAAEAGLRERLLRREFGDDDGLRAAVLAGRPPSEVADLVARAAAAPDRMPPLSVLVEAGHRLFAAPQQSWADGDLEAMVRARGNPELAELARERIATRTANARAVAEAAIRSGQLDPHVATDALTHFSMALSVGLALVDPVATVRPRVTEWDALMTRIGLALAPHRGEEGHDYDVSAPWRLRVTLSDRPAALSRLVGALGALHTYTVDLRIDEARDGERGVYVALVAPPDVSPDVILAAAQSTGTDAYITVGSPDDARDILTRTLDGATRLVRHPEEAPLIAGALVGADRTEVIDATEGIDEQPNVLRLQWTTDRHVLLHRDWGPFTATEQVRASALLRLSAAVGGIPDDPGPAGWIDQVRGDTVWIRLARPEDADAVAAMHDRCSERTRYQRYFSLQAWRDVQLRRLAGGHRGATLVVMSRDGRIVGLGNVFPDPDADAELPTAEIALLVEDAHQGQGIGRVLLRRMLQITPLMGFTHVVAHVLADNRGMLHLLDGTGLSWTTRVQEGVAVMRAELPRPSAPG